MEPHEPHADPEREQPYEPPAVEDLDTSDGPAVTAAGGTLDAST
jgi:hypothetical protein